MSAMIQIRNVPDAVHRRLKSPAALAGMSLSDYLLSQVRELAERPTPEEMRARLARRSEVTLSVTPAEAVRAGRDSRGLWAALEAPLLTRDQRLAGAAGHRAEIVLV